MSVENDPNSPQIWLTYLNPNAVVANGVVVKSCAQWCPKAGQPNGEEIVCGYELALAAARFILDGSTREEESEELKTYIGQKFIGGEVVNPGTGELETLSADGLGPFVDNITKLGEQLAFASKSFSENSKAFTPENIAGLSPAQKSAVSNISVANEAVQSLNPGENPDPALENMRSALKGAIDVGLGEYGLVIRQAVAYGLAGYLKERLPEKIFW